MRRRWKNLQIFRGRLSPVTNPEINPAINPAINQRGPRLHVQLVHLCLR